MWLKLKTIQCVSTKTGERTEEPILELIHTGPAVGTARTSTRIDPGAMHDGQTRLINRSFELTGWGIRVTLIDMDGTIEDTIGSFHVNYNQPMGSYNVLLPQEEGMHGGARVRQYVVYYDVTEEENEQLPARPYLLDLVSIECVDAQEWKDYVFIKVDGQTVWGPRRMRDRGDARHATIEGEPIAISGNASIALWEQDDASRNDLFGEFLLRIGADYDFSRTYTHRFSWRKTREIDATYDLQYRVARRV